MDEDTYFRELKARNTARMRTLVLQRDNVHDLFFLNH